MNLLKRLFGSPTEDYSINDRVIIKQDLRLRSVKHPHPTIWRIDDIIYGSGYKLVHGNPGRTIMVRGTITDSDIVSEEDYMRNLKVKELESI